MSESRTGLHIVLSAPEAVEEFRQAAQSALELEGELTTELRTKLQQKARELEVHPVDEAEVLRQILALPSVQVAKARKMSQVTPTVVSLSEQCVGCFVIPAITAQGMIRRLSRGVIRDVTFLDEAKMLMTTGSGWLLFDLKKNEILWEIDGVVSFSTLSLNKRLLALVLDGWTYIWDTEDGKLLHRLNTHGENKFEVRWVALSDDGRLAALGIVDPVIWDTAWIWIWDIVHGQPLRKMKAEKWLHPCAVFSPDARLLVTGSSSGILFWDTSTGRKARRLKTDEAPNRMLFSSDGRYLVDENSRLSRVRVWDMHRGRVLWERPADIVTWSPDGQRLVLHSPIYDHTPRVIETATGQELQAWQGYDDLVFSPDGRRVAVRREGVYKPKIIEIWNVDYGQRVQQIEISTHYYTPCTFSPDGSRIALWNINDCPLQLWNVASGREEWRLDAQPSISCMAFSPDGCLLAIVLNNTLRLLRVADWQEVYRLSGVRFIAFSPNGRWLVTSGETGIRVRDAVSYQEVKWLAQPSWGPVTFSPDNRMLASFGGRTVCVWDTQEWQVQFRKDLKTWCGEGKSISSVSFSPDGKLLVATGYNWSYVECWNTDNWIEVSLNLRVWVKAPSNMVFGPDGFLATFSPSFSFSSELVLWRMDDDGLHRVIESKYGVNSAAFSPAGRVLAIGFEEDIQLWDVYNVYAVNWWDVASVHGVRWLRGHYGVVNHLAFSPDGRLLVSGDSYGVIRLWQIA
jgi:WD40 repeat protein